MKSRKGFKKIVVDGVEYLYAISSPYEPPSKLIVYEDDKKIDVPIVDVPERPDVPPTWRGKRGDGRFGRYEVAYLIRESKKL